MDIPVQIIYLFFLRVLHFGSLPFFFLSFQHHLWLGVFPPYSLRKQKTQQFNFKKLKKRLLIKKKEKEKEDHNIIPFH